MRSGRPVAKIEPAAAVAGILEGYTQRRKTAQALALRARIVLGCAAGLSNKAVAARERVTAQTVGKWRRRFIERRRLFFSGAPLKKLDSFRTNREHQSRSATEAAYSGR